MPFRDDDPAGLDAALPKSISSHVRANRRASASRFEELRAARGVLPLPPNLKPKAVRFELAKIREIDTSTRTFVRCWQDLCYYWTLSSQSPLVLHDLRGLVRAEAAHVADERTSVCSIRVAHLDDDTFRRLSYTAGSLTVTISDWNISG